MINNRQNGRRRGRGGGSGAPRPNGSNGGQDRGNRIDNRARGNAAQLLEKYKALARDAQMQGDRVNTEYYLQFADHYFRVLSESRARFEDQQPRPRRDDFSQQSDEDYGDEGDRIGADEQQQASEPAYDGRGHDQRAHEPRAHEARERAPRNDFNRSRDDQPRERDARSDREPRFDEARAEQEEERRPRRGRPPRAADRDFEADPAPVTSTSFDAPVAAGEEEVAPVRRRGRPPKVAAAEQIDVDRLPPSLSLTTPAEDGDEPAERPRRARRPRGESAVA